MLEPELHSLDHAASHTFLQADIAFQSPSLPPSNAVVASSSSEDGYWPARKGVTRFPFCFPIPLQSPSSCSFGSNASIAYSLLATVQIQDNSERQILVKSLDVLVVEQWTDWSEEHFHEASEARHRKKESTANLKGEGSVWIEAVTVDRMLWRSGDFEDPDGNIGRERARGSVCVNLLVKNATSQTLVGLKLSLHRSVKVIPSARATHDKRYIPEEKSDEVNLTGREWEFPPDARAKTVVCCIDVPPSERFLSVRKTSLFEINCFARLTVEAGASK